MAACSPLPPRTGTASWPLIHGRTCRPWPCSRQAARHNKLATIQGGHRAPSPYLDSSAPNLRLTLTPCAPWRMLVTAEQQARAFCPFFRQRLSLSDNRIVLNWKQIPGFERSGAPAPPKTARTTQPLESKRLWTPPPAPGRSPLHPSWVPARKRPANPWPSLPKILEPYPSTPVDGLIEARRHDPTPARRCRLSVDTRRRPH